LLGVVHGGARVKAVAARHRLRGFGQGEGDAHVLTLVAPNLEPVRAPPRIGPIDCDPAIVPAFLTGMAVEQQAVCLHDAVDPLHVDRRAALFTALTSEHA